MTALLIKMPTQQPEHSVPAAENEDLGQSIFLPLPETAASPPADPQAGQTIPPVARPDPDAERMRRQAPTSDDRLRRYFPDPGAPPPASKSDPQLESIIVTGSSIQPSADPADWDELIAEARAAKEQGEESRLTRILEYLETHFPDRELPDDLLPGSSNSGDP